MVLSCSSTKNLEIIIWKSIIDIIFDFFFNVMVDHAISY